MTIKELERRTGLPRTSIRFYEQEGLLTPERRENNYRDYSEDNVRTLEKIKLLRRLGVDYETDPAFLARAEEAVYAQRLAELRETNERLATDIANSDDPELIEEIARDELGMVEQGEKIIRFNY